MVLEFSVENYRSFKDKQTLSMIPSESKEEHLQNIITIANKYKVLKSAVIYGANASGKSNFMKAFQALRNLIISPADRSPDASFEEYDPYKFNPLNVSAPIIFEVNFLLNEVRYLYSIAIQKDFVLHETLFYYPQGREAKLFTRKKQNFEFGESLKGQKSVVADLTAKNQLFLSKAASNNIKQLVEVFLFFGKNYMAIPFLDSKMDSYYFDRIAKEIIKEPDGLYVRNFKSLLKSFDTGIVDFNIEEREFPFDIGLGDFEYVISTEHYSFDNEGRKGASVFLPIIEESIGTQKLFVLAGLILRALMNGRIIIVDEFERSLHPLISNYIIRMFNNPKINTKGAQLIIATHDTNLLANNDFRRDQIWIVEKDNTGSSELFSLVDIKGVRDNIPFEKWYLSGRFGGIPGIESLNFEMTYQNETN